MGTVMSQQPTHITHQPRMRGETIAQFCSKLNGVNTQRIQAWLVDNGQLYREEYGFRPTERSRFIRFWPAIITTNGKKIMQCYMLPQGRQWLYEQYLQKKLPMKATWDGELTTLTFNQ